MAEPRRLGRYEILAEIGRGGFAIVYRARDTKLDRIVALKILHSQLITDPKFIRRFRQEAQAAARFDHPHIVTVYDVGEEAGQNYLAMEFLSGQPLSRLVERGPLPVEQAVSVVEQIAGALDVIHSQGLVHRDVKPGNIMLDDTGQTTLLDFGIVRAAEGTRLTTTMAVLGTPEYMAPEQAEIEGAAGVDWRADIYALGVVAYEMLVGRPPFVGKSPTGILYKHIHEPPPAPTALNPGLSPVLELVLLKALAKGREERFQRAGVFAAELRRVLSSESQLRQQDAQLSPLYQRLQAAAAQDDWAEVLTLGGQIQALAPDYRDVSQWMAQARELLRRPRHAPEPGRAARWTPTLTWRTGIVGVFILVMLFYACVTLGSRLWELISVPQATSVPEMPTETPAEQPTEVPATFTEEPTLSPGETQIRSADGMVMVYVPGATFQMGSTGAEIEAAFAGCEQVHGSGSNKCQWSVYEREIPHHYVTLDGFWIDQTEVTNAQFAVFLNTLGNRQEGGVTWLELESEYCLVEQSSGQLQPKSGYARHPVIEVSWYGAAAYCEWVGGRLPTEAEWEYAARGTDGRIYPWGNSFDCAGGNFYDEYTGCNDGYGHAAPVGQFLSGASWCGALDMAGNVWEWVADWYGEYSATEQANPTGPATGVERVMRGGGWRNIPPHVRVADRYGVIPISRTDVVGFRCAMSPGE